MQNLLFAARPLANDVLSTLVFALLVALKIDLRVAVGLSVAVGAGQIALALHRRRPVAALQWMSLGLVMVFGAASLVTDDIRFVMIKPSIIYLVIGATMLQRGWMLRYVPPVAVGRVDDVMTAFGYVWATLMFATAAANLVVAYAFTPHWPAFVAVVPMGSKLVLFAIQFRTVGAVARRRIRGAQAACPAAT